MEINILYNQNSLEKGGRDAISNISLDREGMRKIFENYSVQRVSQNKKSKSSGAGAIYPGLNTIFADLDHLNDDGINRRDAIEEKMDLIMADLPFLLFVKESNSNLHFICYGTNEDEESYKVKASFYLACIARAILKHTGYDLRDIKDASGKCMSLDTHSFSLKQRLFVYPGKKFWDYPYDPADYIVDNRAFDGYEFLISASKKRKEYKGSTSEDEYMTIPGMRWKTGCDIPVRKENTILGYSGHDARWRIAQTIFYMTNWNEDRTRRIIENNFRDPEVWDGSIKILYKEKYSPNHRFIKWVEDTLLEPDPNIPIYEDYDIDGWMIDRIDEIKNFYNEHKRIMIQAPTGTGKTTLVNGMDSKIGLAEALNAVVIVPFNSMVHLYNRMICIKTENNKGARLDDYQSDRPCAIIWDQVLKLWDRIEEDKRPVIVDESHTLFLDRRYRKSAVTLMNKLKEYPYVICISATPCGELETLKLHMLRYNNVRRKVKMDVIKTDKPISVSMLNKCRFHDWFDRVVVFSDNYCRRMHSWLTADLIEHTWLHTWNNGDAKMEKLWKEERLIDPVTLSTSLGFNGVNFNNERERILILLDGRDGMISGQNIVQMIGRIRKSKVKVIVFWGEEIVSSSIDEKREAAKLLEGEDHRIVHFREDLLDDDKFMAAKEIESWMEENTRYETVLKYLKKTGYIDIRELEDMLDDGQKMRDVGNAIRKEVELGWKEEYLDGKVYDIEGDRSREKNEYRKKIDGLYGELIGKLPDRLIREAMEGSKKDAYPSTILEDLLERYIVATMNEEDWKWHVKCLEKCSESSLIGDVLSRRYKEKLQKHIKMREESGKLDGLRGPDGVVDCGDVEKFIEEFIELEKNERFLKRSAAHSKKHKAHKKKMYVWEDFVGTVEEIAVKTGKGISTIKRMIKEGKIIKQD